MKRLVVAAGAVLLCVVVAPSTDGRASARPMAGSTVAVLANPDYVDDGPIEEGGEVRNLIADLEAGGHAVRRFTDISADGITAALDGADALAIPELEADAFLYDEISSAAAAVVRAFVAGGGRLLLVWAFDASAGLNSVFGFSTDTFEGCGSRRGDQCGLTPAAGDTEFADGPAALRGVNTSAAFFSATLPAGSTVVYSRQADVVDEEQPRPAALVELAAVVAVPFGDGAIVAFGWDWFPEVESGPASVADEAGWATVLDLAASQPEVTVSSPSAGQLLLTSDSPVVQPVFTAVAVDGETTLVEIPAGQTSATLVVGAPATVTYAVPGWGVGEGSLTFGGPGGAPPTAPPAAPVPAVPAFTG